jgi:hypothetical protein
MIFTIGPTNTCYFRIKKETLVISLKIITIITIACSYMLPARELFYAQKVKEKAV